jgi:hypothetical protein
MTKDFILKISDIFFYTVDAEYIRNTYTSEWEGGGNWKRYSFIPFKEIWIDNKENPFDLRITAMHEYIEVLNIMLGKDYNDAHECAAKFEDFVRNNESQGHDIDSQMAEN